MAISAIETRYDGCRFRSRLEARWAVFFNEAGLRDQWHYEVEGFRIDTAIGRVNYLPDFWLECGQWVEVKGILNMESVERLCAIASSLASCGSGNDLVVLGEVPRPRSILWPVQLHFHGKLWAVAWEPFALGCPLGRPRVAVEPTETMAMRLVDGFPFGRPDWAEDGLERARCARFEWGENG
jgi:hypothetical protein